MTDTLTHDQIGEMAARIAVRVHGFTVDTAPPALLGYAASLKAAVLACVAAAPDIGKAPPAAIFAALANLARSRLIPGAAGDKTATAYLYLQNRAVVGKPNPNGRLRMAAAAGFDVVTTAIGPDDVVTTGQDGDVSSFTVNLDKRPTTWATLRGVIVSITSHHTGAVRYLWISAGEIDIRKRKSSSGDKGPWASDPVGMARSKAVSIAVDRGDIPQAPIHLHLSAPLSAPQLAAPAAPPARALPDPDRSAIWHRSPDAPPAAPQPPEAAPADAPDPTPTDDAPPAQDAPSAPQDGGAEAQVAPTWQDVEQALCERVEAAVTRALDADDVIIAAAGAIREAQAGAAAKGRTLTPGAALDPKALDRLTAMAVARLDAM